MESVEEVWVDGLYGEFNHRVELHPEWPFAIVYGPNGVGKTRFFGAIFALGRLKARTLARAPLDSVGIRYSDGACLTVERTEGLEGVRLKFTLSGGGRSDPDVWNWPPSLEELDRQEVMAMRRERSRLLGPRWRDLGDGTWENRADETILTDAEVEAITGQNLDELQENLPPEVFSEFVEKRPVYFIETQRLLVGGSRRNAAQRHPSNRYRPESGTGPSREDTVSSYADDLRRRLNSALVENSRRSQELDRTFPTRLLQEDLQRSVAEENTIRKRHADQDDKRRRLAELGLTPDLPTVGLPDVKLDALKLSVLSLYLDDSEAKLRSFDDVLAKSDLLKSIVNRRFLRKSLEVNAEQGLVVVPDSGSGPLDPAKLSSGEKHELIMFYDMIFSASEGTLVLIDEPEISLHVSWQRQFLKDIEMVAELTGIRVLIATHSPQIIGSHRDRTTELGSAEDLEAMGQ